MKIQAILFDFGGTLDSDGLDWFSRLYEAILLQTGDFPRGWFEKAAQLAANDASNMPDTPSLLMDQMVLRLSECILARMMEDSSCNIPSWDPQKVAERFMEQASTYLRRNRTILEQLKSRYVLGCISNNWGNTAGWCEQFGLHKLFSTIVDSALEGAVKPDRSIFRTALNNLNLPAQACAYVGDRLDCDIAGSYNAGMTPIWINQPGCPPQDTANISVEIDKLLRIGSVPDLLILSLN